MLISNAMNPRIEKLCLPRHRREAVWKFWQPSISYHSHRNQLIIFDFQTLN